MNKFLSAALVATVAFAAPAAAAVVSYTDSALFSAATQSPSSYAFSGEGIEFDYINNFADMGYSYSYGPATFSAANGLVLFNDTYSYGGALHLQAENGIDVALDGVRAIAFNVGIWNYTGGTVQVSVNGVLTASFDTGAAPDQKFIGFTSDQMINSVRFTAVRALSDEPPLFRDLEGEGDCPPEFEGCDFPDLPTGPLPANFDILSYQIAQFTPQVDEPTDVPEPAMLGLFGLGALGLALSRRRRA